MVVVDRLLPAHCTARRLWGAAMASAARKCACRRHCRGTPELEGRRLLDGARGGARGPSRRGDRAYFNGCGGGFPPFGFFPWGLFFCPFYSCLSPTRPFPPASP